MRIGIDASCWVNPRGYGRYARGLLHALIQYPEHEYIFFADEQTSALADFPEGVTVRTTRTNQSVNAAARADGARSVRDMIAISRLMQQTPMDVLFFPSVFTFVPVLTSAKIWVAVHDVIAEDFPEIVFPQWKNRYLWMVKGWLARRQANKIITVSDHAKRGISRKFSYSSDDIVVVGEAADSSFYIMPPQIIQPILERYRLLNTPYFVCLGGLNPHKNIPFLIEQFAKLRDDGIEMKLVLIGLGEEDSFTPGINAVREAVVHHQLEASVIFTGYLPDENVSALLNAAQALVLPSLMEGYGLGAIEAAACQTPVIVTTNSPMPEILEGGGLFIDPKDAQELFMALKIMATQPECREQFAQCAYERVSQLTWDSAAQSFLLALERL